MLGRWGKGISCAEQLYIGIYSLQEYINQGRSLNMATSPLPTQDQQIKMNTHGLMSKTNLQNQ